MGADLFASTAHLWSARPSDPNDVFVAQVIEKGFPRPDAPPAIALFGVPFDGAVLGRPGAREGPDAIRAQMARLKPRPMRTVYDAGNVRLPHGDISAAHQATESAALALLAEDHLPVALGGDHSLTFPLAKAHEGRRQKLGVINLDAHLDVRDFHGQPNSGTSFGRLLDLGLVPGENLVEVGLRGFANAEAYERKAQKAGATLISADAWMDDPKGAILRAIDIAARGTDGVYLSVDLDVLDQAHAPGVSAPTPGGVDTATLLQAVAQIAASGRLVGADFMEVAPPLDRDGMTSRAAAWAVTALLAEL
ncbi:MAG: formiminoglutamase [Thermoplasmata archaeon]|jgi:formiminoglutamase/agmatinase|nr:formiminoglutamase [Thermoplasmata archaeon]